jgi:hypothetical protein
MHSQGMQTAMATDMVEIDLVDDDVLCQSPKELAVAINMIAAIFPSDPHGLTAI